MRCVDIEVIDIGAKLVITSLTLKNVRLVIVDNVSKRNEQREAKRIRK